MNHSDIVNALTRLYPEAKWELNGDNFDNLVWLESSSKPTKEIIEAEINNPTPVPEPTVPEKLALVGLSVNDLKAALGLGSN
jgi:hypothetical protein